MQKERIMYILKLLASAFVALLDFAAGSFIVLMLGGLLGYHPTFLECASGGLLALLPDTDIIYQYLRRGHPYGNHHEYVTHRPFAMLSLTALVAFLMGNHFWMIAAPVCVFWHYVHDTEGFGGGGIAWFWPLSRMYVSPITGSTKPEESKCNGAHDGWLESLWLTPSKTSLIELTLAFLMLGLVYTRILGVIALFLLWLLFGIIAGTWAYHARRFPKTI